MKVSRKTDQKPIIAIDIDDVLSDYAGSLVEFANLRWHAGLTRELVSENWSKMFNIDGDEWLKRFDEFMTIDPYAEMANMGGEQALTVLHQLKKQFQLVSLTSRPLDVVDITNDWLNQYFPGVFNDVIFGVPYQNGEDPNKWEKRTKADLAMKIGATYLIDDQPKHANSFAKIDGKSLLFGDYGWNRDAEILPGVTRVADWGEVADYFGV